MSVSDTEDKTGGEIRQEHRQEESGYEVYKIKDAGASGISVPAIDIDALGLETLKGEEAVYQQQYPVGHRHEEDMMHHDVEGLIGYEVHEGVILEGGGQYPRYPYPEEYAGQGNDVWDQQSRERGVPRKAFGGHVVDRELDISDPVNEDEINKHRNR